MLPFASQYLKANYKGKVTILSRFCPTCLEASEHRTVTPDWPCLFQDRIFPEQALNAFDPLEGTLGELLDLKTAARPCQECAPQCWVCQSPIAKGQTIVSTERLPSLRVHRTCVVRCDQAGCPVYLETIPRYVPFSAPKLLCSRHTPEVRLQPQKPVKPNRPKPDAKTFPKPDAKQAPPRPTHPKPKPLKPTAASQKLIKINKECKTRPISAFLATPKKEHTPDEMVCRRDTGEPWAYRRDGVLYRISDDEPVEDRRERAAPSKRKKFDFSPPASDPPEAQEEHEGQASRQDPDEGARPVGALVDEPVADGEEQ